MDRRTDRKLDAEKEGGLILARITATAPLLASKERGGRLLRLTLNRPKANLIDMAMADSIRAALDQHRDDDRLAGVLLDHRGDNFSYGASIPEHLPDSCGEMLGGMHAMVNIMVAFPLPILVSIRGWCLGGGLELACAGTFLFAAPDALLGQPEIKLAVFAPTASVLLPERIGQARADELLLSGRTMDGIEAEALGLVTGVADAPSEAALSWFDEHLATRSSPALRAATMAARHGYVERVAEKLAWVEKYYLEDLMRLEDPVEGLKAFMEKRPPVWKHR